MSKQLRHSGVGGKKPKWSVISQRGRTDQAALCKTIPLFSSPFCWGRGKEGEGGVVELQSNSAAEPKSNPNVLFFLPSSMCDDNPAVYFKGWG